MTERRTCGVKGCERVAHRGDLCRTHWQMVPYEDRQRVAIQSMIAAHNVAKREHARFLRLVRAKVKEQAAA